MAGHRLGDLSMRFETSCRPGEEAKAAAKVSTGMMGAGKADPGGKSYGAYQLTSTVQGGQQVLAFLRAEGKQWEARFAGSDPAKPGKFEATWKAIAAEAAMAFFTAQHDFIQRTHFKPVIAAVLAKTGVDLMARAAAVRDVVWSMSVQHGKASLMCIATVEALRVRVPLTDPGYDRALINALYDRREALVRAIGQTQLIAGRYVPERQDALAMLAQE